MARLAAHDYQWHSREADRIVHVVGCVSMSGGWAFLEGEGAEGIQDRCRGRLLGVGMIRVVLGGLDPALRSRAVEVLTKKYF